MGDNSNKALVALAVTVASGRRYMRWAVIVVCAVLIVSPTEVVNAQQQSRTGIITCTTGLGIGLIVGSTKRVDCVYRPDRPAPPQQYTGRMNKLGLDIGITGGTVIKWAVFASPKSGVYSVPGGALAGRFVGASAEGTIGLGLGANVLVGGTNDAYVLQPLSVQGQVGLNLALGITGLTLRRVN